MKTLKEIGWLIALLIVAVIGFAQGFSQASGPTGIRLFDWVLSLLK